MVLVTNPNPPCPTPTPNPSPNPNQVLVTNQIKHPDDARYHRMQAGNANFKKLLALPGARALLCALGFVEREGGATWRWLTLTLNPNPKP